MYSNLWVLLDFTVYNVSDERAIRFGNYLKMTFKYYFRFVFEKKNNVQKQKTRKMLN